MDLSWKQFWQWAAIAFVAWWIISDPSGAAHVVHGAGGFLTRTAHSVTVFFTAI